MYDRNTWTDVEYDITRQCSSLCLALLSSRDLSPYYVNDLTDLHKNHIVVYATFRLYFVRTLKNIVLAFWTILQDWFKKSPRTCILCCRISPVQKPGFVFTVDSIACTGHFVRVPLILTYLHCLQHFSFEHLFNLYYIPLTVFHTYVIQTSNYANSLAPHYAIHFDSVSYYICMFQNISRGLFFLTTSLV